MEIIRIRGIDPGVEEEDIKGIREAPTLVLVAQCGSSSEKYISIKLPSYTCNTEEMNAIRVRVRYMTYPSSKCLNL